MTPYSTVDGSAPETGSVPAGEARGEASAEQGQGVDQEVETGNGTRNSQADPAALAAADAGLRSTLGAPVRFPGEDGGRSLAEMAQNDLDAALQLLADRAQYITGANGAAIALRRSGKNDMQCRASTGENVPELGALLSTEFGLSGESVRTRRALRCDDAERDPRVNREGCRQLGIASVVVMPVVNDDEVLGVFELFSGKVNAFGERDLSALQRLSEMVETAVKLARAAEGVPLLSGVPAAAVEIADDQILGEEILGEVTLGDEILGDEILEVPDSGLAVEAEKPAERPELGASGAEAQAEENSLLEALEALRPPKANSSADAGGVSASDEVSPPPVTEIVPELVAERPQQSASPIPAPNTLPKKPLFWSAAMNPITDAEKAAEADQSHVPPVLRNLRKCEACGFPVSPGRALCVECEEKRWRGQLRRPSVLPQTPAPAPAQKALLAASKPPLLAKDARNGAPGAGNGASADAAASSGPVAHLVAAAAAQSSGQSASVQAASVQTAGAAAAPALARESAAEAVSAPKTLPAPVAAPVVRGEESKPAAVVPPSVTSNPPISEAATAAAKATSETPVPDFVLSAGLEPSQSWLGRNKYIVVAILVVAATVAAVLFLR